MERKDDDGGAYEEEPFREETRGFGEVGGEGGKEFGHCGVWW